MLVALPLSAAVAGDGEARPRRDLPHQGRRAAALEGDGDRELPHRRLRPAAHRLAQHEGSRRLGAEDDEGLGPDQRAPREAWPFGRGWQNQRFIANAADAARLPAHRLPESVDARHQRAGDRRRGHRGDQRRRRTSTTFRGKLRGKFVLGTRDARRAGAFRGAGPPLHRRRARGPRRSSPPRPAGGTRRQRRRPARRSTRKKTQFWIDEGVAAVLDFSRGDGGTLFVQARRLARRRRIRRRRRRSCSPSSTTAASARTLEKKIPVTLQMDIDNKFYDADLNSFNIVGELPGHRQGRRGRDARRALRLVAHRHRRHRQRRRIGGDDGSDAHPEDERRQAAPHRAHRALGRRGRRAARLEGIREGALRRSGDDAAEAGAREARGLLQRRQRHRH